MDSDNLMWKLTIFNNYGNAVLSILNFKEVEDCFVEDLVTQCPENEN